MSVTAAKGWRAAGVKAGTKPSGELDLALVVSDVPATVAAAFTTNSAAGAPITLCRPRVAAGHAQAIAVSAGSANTATGAAGLSDALKMADALAEATGTPPEQALVSSTGTIGDRIKLDLIIPAITKAAAELSPEGGEFAARAIMTTDTKLKTSVRQVGGNIVGGMAKGAGMIAPHMAVPQATMLAFITTDAELDAQTLQRIVADGLPSTFNRITVDGCMSTNDTVFLMANGVTGPPDDLAAFTAAVHEVMDELAYAIVSDGEGATKVIRITVTGATSDGDADTAARAIADSVLFRAAVWGGDPNWGRIVQAVGQSKAGYDPDKVKVAIGGVVLAVEGLATGQASAAADTLKSDEVTVDIDLGQGTGHAEILTCDLTPAYVTFNGDYTT